MLLNVCTISILSCMQILLQSIIYKVVHYDCYDNSDILPAIISKEHSNFSYVDVCIIMPPPYLFIATSAIAYSKLI
jgi:hypothetical protein